MSRRRTLRFRHGDVFVRNFVTTAGTLRVHGTVGVDRQGRLLLLWDVDIRPVEGDRLALGAGTVRRIFASLCALAAADGFDTLVVTGYRITGANPSRFADVALDCRPVRTGPRPVGESERSATDGRAQAHRSRVRARRGVDADRPGTAAAG